MSDYLLARGFVDRLVSRLERMTNYSGAETERKELEDLIFKGKFTIYGRLVNHRVHWVDLYEAYLKAVRMPGNAKIKVELIDGKKQRFKSSEIRKIFLDVIRKVEEISAKILIKTLSNAPQAQQGSPFAGMTQLGFKETTFDDVAVDLAFDQPPGAPELGIDEEEEIDEVALAKHSQPIE